MNKYQNVKSMLKRFSQALDANNHHDVINNDNEVSTYIEEIKSLSSPDRRMKS